MDNYTPLSIAAFFLGHNSAVAINPEQFGIKAITNHANNAKLFPAAVLKKLNLPVLFVIGKEDSAIPYELSLKQTHLPDLADIQILEGVGHMGMIEAHKKLKSLR